MGGRQSSVRTHAEKSTELFARLPAEWLDSRFLIMSIDIFKRYKFAIGSTIPTDGPEMLIHPLP